MKPAVISKFELFSPLFFIVVEPVFISISVVCIFKLYSYNMLQKKHFSELLKLSISFIVNTFV